MTRILITGVTGFIGTNLVNYFKNVPQVKLFGHSRQTTLPVEVERVNSLTAKIINQHSIDLVIHLAGIAHDLSGQYKPEDYYRVNQEQTQTLYNQFLKSKASKFIFLSSIKAAVDTATEPTDENVVAAPVTDYGKSKLLAEQFLLSNIVPGKSTYIFRPCMIHGPGNKGNLNVLYQFVKKGLPYPFAAFQNQRSFLSMDNLTFIINQFIEREISSGLYHLADDGSLSSNELYILIAQASNQKPKLLALPPAIINFLFSLIGKRAILKKLTESMLVNNTKVKQVIQQQLPVDIRQGIIKTIQSFRG